MFEPHLSTMQGLSSTPHEEVSKKQPRAHENPNVVKSKRYLQWKTPIRVLEVPKSVWDILLASCSFPAGAKTTCFYIFSIFSLFCEFSLFSSFSSVCSDCSFIFFRLFCLSFLPFLLSFFVFISSTYNILLKNLIEFVGSAKSPLVSKEFVWIVLACFSLWNFGTHAQVEAEAKKWQVATIWTLEKSRVAPKAVFTSQLS